ncbi:MAG: phosphatase PAP2 family protein [Actinomycetota bacterium]|nr:phosphatase PAP2 family protein [Actinomycetota bacterium]
MTNWSRRRGRQVGLLDRELVRRSARIPPSTLDPAMKLLTGAANHGMLWFAVAAALAVSKGRPRRAAIRGVLAIAGTSFTSNALAKPFLPRRRPAYEDVPARRTIPNPPASSSFPSGHSASAAAFTTAVALEAPLVGAVLAPVAAAVAYSRVHTGVHWPSDVVAGLVLGSGIALATRRWWPVRPEPAAAARRCEDAAALPGGDGLVVLVNPGSGFETDDPAADLAVALPAARVLVADLDADLAEQLEQAVLDHGAVALGVAGGDGTVACAAAVASRLQLPLAVVPTGTLNHFARDVGIEGLPDAARAVQAGSAVSVDLASVSVDGEPSTRFVNTASLGAYIVMVRRRERFRETWGKWPAAALGVVASMRHTVPLRVRIGGRSERVWMVFVGNGTYEPDGMAPGFRPRLDTGLLDVRYLRADGPFSRTRFVLGVLTGALHRSRSYVQRRVPELHLEVMGRPATLATDGEIGEPGRRFHFRSDRATLLVYRPATARLEPRQASMSLPATPPGPRQASMSRFVGRVFGR